MINIQDGTGRFTKRCIASARSQVQNTVQMFISSRAMLQVRSFGPEEVDEFTRREIATGTTQIFGVKLLENPELPDSECIIVNSDDEEFVAEF
jgi:NAD-dependent DNA ligase